MQRLADNVIQISLLTVKLVHSLPKIYLQFTSGLLSPVSFYLTKVDVTALQ